ncbi:MAG: extracellular solute-binding protein [Clostridia bacterium]|nr:extracellular solute-binding protein [Clostridia bacterium]
MKRKLFALIAVLLLIFTIGCENVEYIEKSDDPDESVNIYEKLESDLPDLNDGDTPIAQQQTLKIVTDKKTVFLNDESNPASINKAITDRNAFLKSKYGANIEVVEVASNKVADELKAAVASDMEYCDMLSISARETVKLFTAKLLTDMNTLPDFNAENTFFDKENATSLATNQTFYMLADPTALVYDEMYVFFYNNDIVQKSGQNPETLVMQGKWTWDRFNEIAKASAPDVYNKVSADLNNDVFAFGAYYLEGTYPLVMWTSSGEKLIKDTYKKPVGFSMNTDDVVNIAEKLMQSYNSRGKYPMSEKSATNAFLNNRLAFFCNKFDFFYALRDGTTKGSNYGILPIPKVNEEQDGYNCLVSSDARVFSVPITVANDSEDRKRFVSAVLSATCASGNNTIPKAYANHHIGMYLNNNSEAVMFNTVIDSLTFDFANVFGSGIYEVRLHTTAAIVDYLDIGSGLVNSINYSKAGFDSYCATNFN